MADDQKLLIIGLGNMSGAMLAGWLSAGMDPACFAALGRRQITAPDGVQTFSDPARVSGHDAVMLGFKPQQLGDVAPTLQGVTGEGVTVYSLLAGITLDQLKEAFPQAHAHVRVMPNLASRISKSPVILAESGLDEAGRETVFTLFDKLGVAVWLADETHYNLATALAGSGPGFVYRFIDALSAAATELGLDRERAQNLALTMVEGASALAAEAELSPSELAERVASPGGMTREGLDVLDQDAALQRLLAQTLRATSDRGAELATGSK
ncbi:MAG: pyrroline-5-carboxylate reductase dimerization domain-containing protein [Pseudomonadota bacterium]